MDCLHQCDCELAMALKGHQEFRKQVIRKLKALLAEVEHVEDAENPKRNGVNGHKRFVPPTVEEVASYCTERDNGIQARSFWDYYQAKGWRVGSTPMKDWRAAVRQWEERNRNGINGSQRRGLMLVPE